MMKSFNSVLIKSCKRGFSSKSLTEILRDQIPAKQEVYYFIYISVRSFLIKNNSF